MSGSEVHISCLWDAQETIFLSFRIPEWQIIMRVFLEHLSISNMLSYAVHVQIQKYKTHAYKTPKTACVQTIQLRSKDGR